MVTGHTYHTPPEGVCIAFKVHFTIFVHLVFFCQVDKVWGEDQTQESYIQSGDQLLQQCQTVISNIESAVCG